MNVLLFKSEYITHYLAQIFSLYFLVFYFIFLFTTNIHNFTRFSYYSLETFCYTTLINFNCLWLCSVISYIINERSFVMIFRAFESESVLAMSMLCVVHITTRQRRYLFGQLMLHIYYSILFCNMNAGRRCGKLFDKVFCISFSFAANLYRSFLLRCRKGRFKSNSSIYCVLLEIQHSEICPN